MSAAVGVGRHVIGQMKMVGGLSLTRDIKLEVI